MRSSAGRARDRRGPRPRDRQRGRGARRAGDRPGARHRRLGQPSPVLGRRRDPGPCLAHAGDGGDRSEPHPCRFADRHRGGDDSRDRRCGLARAARRRGQGAGRRSRDRGDHSRRAGAAVGAPVRDPARCAARRVPAPLARVPDHGVPAAPARSDGALAQRSDPRSRGVPLPVHGSAAQPVHRDHHRRHQRTAAALRPPPGRRIVVRPRVGRHPRQYGALRARDARRRAARRPRGAREASAPRRRRLGHHAERSGVHRRGRRESREPDGPLQYGQRRRNQHRRLPGPHVGHAPGRGHRALRELSLPCSDPRRPAAAQRRHRRRSQPAAAVRHEVRRAVPPVAADRRSRSRPARRRRRSSRSRRPATSSASSRGPTSSAACTRHLPTKSCSASSVCGAC